MIEERGEGDAEAGGYLLQHHGGGAGLATLDQRQHRAADVAAMRQALEAQFRGGSKSANAAGNAGVDVHHTVRGVQPTGWLHSVKRRRKILQSNHHETSKYLIRLADRALA